MKKERVQLLTGVLSSTLIATSPMLAVNAFAEEPAGTYIVGQDADSIADALSKANSGDTIKIPAGTYNEQISITKDGIKLVGEPGAVLDGTGITPTAESYAMIRVSAPDVSITGLEITGLKNNEPSLTVKPMGIYADSASDDLSVSECKIHDMGVVYNEESEFYNAHGILVYAEPDDPVDNVSIKNCELYNLTLGNSEALVVNGNVGNFDISGNYVHNCDNIGIDAIGFERCGDDGESLKLESDRAHDGKIHDNTVVGISSGKNMTYFGDKCAGGIYVDGGKNIDIYENYIADSDIGIEVSSEHHGTAVTGINVYNNTLVQNDALAGISIGGCEPDENGEAKACKIYNNTVLNTDNNCLNVQVAHDKSNVIEKNIFIAANEAEVYYEETGEYSEGNTINDNASNQKFRVDPENKVFKLVGVSAENNVVRLESTLGLEGYGAKSTKVIQMAFNED